MSETSPPRAAGTMPYAPQARAGRVGRAPRADVEEVEAGARRCLRRSRSPPGSSRLTSEAHSAPMATQARMRSAAASASPSSAARATSRGVDLGGHPREHGQPRRSPRRAGRVPRARWRCPRRWPPRARCRRSRTAARRVHHEVADLAGVPSRPMSGRPSTIDAAADASRHGHVDRVGGAAGGAVAPFGHDGHVRVPLEDDRRSSVTGPRGRHVVPRAGSAARSPRRGHADRAVRARRCRADGCGQAGFGRLVTDAGGHLADPIDDRGHPLLVPGRLRGGSAPIGPG